MTTTFVTGPEGDLLRAVRSTLSHGDELLVCVAFATHAGVNLVLRELARGRGAPRPRVVVTSQLSTTQQALEVLATTADIAIHNPRSRSTYHPKVFLSRSRTSASAVIGSVNLTNGLAVNVEAGVYYEGSPRNRLFSDAWGWAEALWTHDVTERWTKPYDLQPVEEIYPGLLARIEAAIGHDATVRTLSRGRPNRVSDVTPSAVYVETDRSRAAKTPPQPVPAWMLNLAWEVLHARGQLTNQHLLNDLRVHRSSFVLALLARLPGIRPLSGRRMGVELAPDEHKPAPQGAGRA